MVVTVSHVLEAAQSVVALVSFVQDVRAFCQEVKSNKARTHAFSGQLG
jgi:hypothetical protein